MTRSRIITIFIVGCFLYMTSVLFWGAVNYSYQEKMEETRLYEHIVKDSVNWPRATSTSLSSTMECTHHVDRACETWVPIVKYIYIAKGHSYSSTALLQDLKTKDKNYLEKHPLNLTGVYFDPNDPSLSVLTPKVPNHDLDNCTSHDCFLEALLETLFSTFEQTILLLVIMLVIMYSINFLSAFW